MLFGKEVMVIVKEKWELFLNYVWWLVYSGGKFIF